MVVYADGGAQVGVRGALAERDPLAAVFNYNAPVLDSRQPPQHRATREAIEYRWTSRPRRIDTRRNNGIRLGHLDASNYTRPHRYASGNTPKKKPPGKGRAVGTTNSIS